MPKTKPWSELARQIPDTPERRIRKKEVLRAMDIGAMLGELQDHGWTVEDEQHDVLTIEHEEGVYLSAIRTYVELLGELEINAVFPGRTVRLVPPEDA